MLFVCASVPGGGGSQFTSPGSELAEFSRSSLGSVASIYRSETSAYQARL